MTKLLLTMSLLTTFSATAAPLSGSSIIKKFAARGALNSLSGPKSIDLNRIAHLPNRQIRPHEKDGLQFLDRSGNTQSGPRTFNHLTADDDHLTLNTFPVIPPRGMSPSGLYEPELAARNSVRLSYSPGPGQQTIDVRQNFSVLKSNVSDDSFVRIHTEVISDGYGKTIATRINPEEGIAFQIQLSPKLFAHRDSGLKVSMTGENAKKMFGDNTELLRIESPIDLNPYGEFSIITIQGSTMRRHIMKLVENADGTYRLRRSSHRPLSAKEISNFKIQTMKFKTMPTEEIIIPRADELSRVETAVN